MRTLDWPTTQMSAAGVTGEWRRSRFDLDGAVSEVTAIKSGRELLLALGHPLMNDMKQMCERWRSRRNDGGAER